MKIQKRLLVLVLVVATCAWLAGCSSGSSTNNASNGNSNQTADTSGGNTQTKMKMVIYGDANLLAAKPEGSDPAWFNEVHDYIEQQTGIDVSVILPSSDLAAAKTKLNLMLSSGEDMDVWQGDWIEYKDAIMPINDLLDKYGQNIKNAYSEEDWNLMTDKDGKIWGIPRAPSVAAFPIFVRADWLKKVNLPMPKTIDELENVLKAFKEQIPGSIPLMTENLNQQNLRKSFLGGFTEYGDSNWWDPSDGKLKIPEQDPGFKDFLAKMADWYQKGYIYKDALGKVDHLQVMKTGNIGVEASWYSRTTLMSPQAKTSFPDMDFQIAGGLTGPKGLVSTARPGNATAAVFNKNAKNPETTMKYINWIYENYDNYMTIIYGLEGKSWEWVDEANHKYKFLDNDKHYVGEFMIGDPWPMESQVSTDDPTSQMHLDYLKNNIYKLDEVKIPVDVGVVYDPDAKNDQVPQAADIERLRNEEETKFIMGARPISEYDQFMNELKKAGLDQLVDFQTEQYKSQRNTN